MRRKPLKTTLLLMVFTLGVVSVVALYLVSLVVGDSLEKQLSSYGANIIVSPKVDSLKVSYGGFSLGEMYFDVPVAKENETISSINSIGYRDRISIVAPKLVAMAKVNDTPMGVVGVDWQAEQALKSYWATQGNFPKTPHEIVVGSAIAQNLGFKAGDQVDLFDRAFTISGVLYPTGTDDDSVALMGLSTLQKIQGKENTVSFIEIAALCSGCPIGDIVGQLRSVLPANIEVKALQNVVNQRMASIKFVQQLAFMVSIIILITGATMMSISMLSSVHERKKDIGILRSLGFSTFKVFFIFCVEAGLIGVVGGIVGYCVGFFSSIKIVHLLSLQDAVMPTFSLIQLVITCALFGTIALISALYPAWKGASIQPSQALVAL